MSRDRVGVLGSGAVGRALGRGFADRGWDVLVGTGHPEQLADWVTETAGAVEIGSFADAAAHGDVAVLAVRGAVAMDVIQQAGTGSFDGTLLLDTTNPLDVSGDGPPALLFGGTDSLGERIQAALPEAAVVKCFNTVSNVQMVDPAFEACTPRMFVCGDDAAAKERTEDVLVDFGWPGSLDVGDISAARYLEAMVPLWVRVGAVLDTWRHMLAPVR